MQARHFSLVLHLLAGLFLGQAVCAEDEVPTGREEYEIPGHGVLVMDVPTTWQATFYQPENDGFPIISFFPFKGPRTFEMSVAVFWTESALRDLTDPHNLRQFVESVGQEVLEQSDQDTLELKEIAGDSGVGYLFDLTDKQAGEGEYPHLTQGALAVGNVVVVFSLFTREKQYEQLRENALKMLKNAEQDLSRRDVSY